MLPVKATSSFTTVAGQGWLAGPKPSLDAQRDIASKIGQSNLTKLFARSRSASKTGFELIFDVQSFIWVIGAYKDRQQVPTAGGRPSLAS